MKPTVPFTPVKSRVFDGVHYDEAAQALSIRFTPSGAVWRYAGVSPGAFSRFMAADSLGKHFGSEIKTRHKGERV